MWDIISIFGLEFRLIPAIPTMVFILGALAALAKFAKSLRNQIKDGIMREEKITSALEELPLIRSDLKNISTNIEKLEKRIYIVEIKNGAILDHILGGLSKEEIAKSILEAMKYNNPKYKRTDNLSKKLLNWANSVVIKK